MSFDIREITSDFKINYIIAIIACTFGINSGIVLYDFSYIPFLYDAYYIASLIILVSIISLLGIYYFKRDYRLTIAIYIIAGIIIIWSTRMHMNQVIITFILYIIAAIVAYLENNNYINNNFNNNLDNNEKDSNDDIHYYN